MGSLDGRRIVVTRRKAPSGSLADRLRSLGATVVEVPAIEIVPPPDLGPLDDALADLEAYDWVVVTSPNAVAALLSRLTVLGLFPRLSGGSRKVASVGPATTAALRASFPQDKVVLEPGEDHRALGLVAAFADKDLASRRVLLPASTIGREELPAGLRARGARVDVVAAYATVEPDGLSEAVDRCLNEGFDLAIFASPSAVEAFASAAGERAVGRPVAVIGPTTEAAARAKGFDVRATAASATVEALVEAAQRVLANPRP